MDSGTDTHADLEEFTCLMFVYPSDKDINTVRSKMLKKMVGENTSLNSKVDFSKLPPCSENLLPHIYRVNCHQVGEKIRLVGLLSFIVESGLKIIFESTSDNISIGL